MSFICMEANVYVLDAVQGQKLGSRTWRHIQYARWPRGRRLKQSSETWADLKRDSSSSPNLTRMLVSCFLFGFPKLFCTHGLSG